MLALILCKPGEAHSYECALSLCWFIFMHMDHRREVLRKGEGMDFSILPQVLPRFLQGTLNTIIYCAVSFPLALLLGVILAIMSSSRFIWLRGPARIYIEVIRSTPFIA